MPFPNATRGLWPIFLWNVNGIVIFVVVVGVSMISFLSAVLAVDDLTDEVIVQSLIFFSE